MGTGISQFDGRVSFVLSQVSTRPEAPIFTSIYTIQDLVHRREKFDGRELRAHIPVCLERQSILVTEKENGNRVYPSTYCFLWLRDRSCESLRSIRRQHIAEYLAAH